MKHSNITSTTIQTYLSYLEDAFLLEKSMRYDIKGKRYIESPAKYYFVDLGLRNARLQFRQTEETHLMENLIYNELRLRGLSVDVGSVTRIERNEQGNSVRRLLEVDFVCNLGYKRWYYCFESSFGSSFVVATICSGNAADGSGSPGRPDGCRPPSQSGCGSRP